MLKVLGLVPVPVDIELSNLQINTNQIEKKLAKKLGQFCLFTIMEVYAN